MNQPLEYSIAALSPQYIKDGRVEKSKMIPSIHSLTHEDGKIIKRIVCVLSNTDELEQISLKFF